MSSEPGHQLGQPERFGQVVVRSRVQSGDHVELTGPGRQHDDDPVRRCGPEATAQSHPVDVGQAQVEQD
jgi:hypothetical protein